MWVIYSEETGEEIDRVDGYHAANEWFKHYNDNEFGNRFAKRWEE